MNNFIAVFIGGGIGSIMRYGISHFIRYKFSPVFPFATLCANVLSCIILTLTVTYFSDKLPATFKTFILVGVCGGFSTFSTYSYETIELIRSGNWFYALVNVFINLILCLGIIFVFVKSGQ